ncbi:efflux RND transporter permease subunit [Anaplasma phagocytophilum]|nr:efflux RND transporter permease subunit [Anaplasma phagocytophilum]
MVDSACRFCLLDHKRLYNINNMNVIADYFLKNNRFTLFLLLFIAILGVYSYWMLPQERTPTIKIPVISVRAVVNGISAERAEKLLAIPMEKELRAVSGIKKVLSEVRDGHVSVALKFNHDTNMRIAMEDVRNQLDVIRPKLPRQLTSLTVQEMDLGSMPILHLAIVGDIEAVVLSKVARELKSKIEPLRDVLSVETEGLHEYVLELNFSPELVNYHGIQIQDIQRALSSSYAFVEYGMLESDVGSHKVKLEGELDSYKKIMDLVLKAGEGQFVTVRDVATVRFARKDNHELVRVNGKPAVVLKVAKREGSNITEVVKRVEHICDSAARFLPKDVSLLFLQDQSEEVKSALRELENTLVFSVILVSVVMMIFMGIRTAILIAVAIPVSVLFSITVVYLMGYTINIVILFTLIMVIGMLVDDAIVVSEYADRKMAHGFSRLEAYRLAATAMFGPVATSTMIRLSVFIPLLFWPGFTGEFMKYIPVVSISALVGSWITALIFTPVLGAMFGRGSATSPGELARVNAIEDIDIENLGKGARFYTKVLGVVLDHPIKFVSIVSGVLIFSTVAYFTLGPGGEFFPDIEPDQATITVKSDSNLSLKEKDFLMKEVEGRISEVAGIKYLYTRLSDSKASTSSEVLGVIHVEFVNWYLRAKSSKVLRNIETLLKDMKGVFFDIAQYSMKPSVGKQLEISLRADDPALVQKAARVLQKEMSASQGFRGVSSDNPVSGMEWVMMVDRKKADVAAVSVSMIGQYIKMLTDGLLVGTYYPKDSTDGVDIIARFQEKHRSLKYLDNFLINTMYGPRPVSSFISRKARSSTGTINRIDGLRAITISSDIAPGYSIADRVRYVKEVLDREPRVEVAFLGDMEDQAASETFLIKSFFLILLMIALVLIAEFNSWYYVMVVMTAVFLSTTCVFLGFLLTSKVFGIVMGGVGIIVLAGVVVNNNILLVDAFCANIKSGLSYRDAIIKSALSRFRPIFLTVITGVLGLMPMVLRLSVDFIGRNILYDSPTSQLWFELSTTTSMGLLFATAVTLLFTPAVLMCGGRQKSSHKVL